MITVIAFAAAAAVGALARAEIGRRCDRQRVPAGTLIVNVTGSFLLGLIVNVEPPAITVLGTAGLGAYTTFASFARDTVALAEQRRLALAAGYVGATVTLTTAAAAAGIAIAG